MGFKISWIGFNGIDREEVLRRLSFADTGQSVDYPEDGFALCELPNGWLIVVSQDFDYADEPRLAKVSSGATVIGCQIHEGVMYSGAALYNDRHKVWSITHFSDDGPLDLKVAGAPPDEIRQISAKLMAEQVERGAATRTDFLFDAPIQAARLVTGYQHDQWKFEVLERYAVLRAR